MTKTRITEVNGKFLAEFRHPGDWAWKILGTYETRFAALKALGIM